TLFCSYEELPCVELPLLEDGGLFCLVEILAGDDVGGVLEHAARGSQRLLLVIVVEHISILFPQPNFAPRRPLGQVSWGWAWISYIACSCVSSHTSNGRLARDLR